MMSGVCALHRKMRSVAAESINSRLTLIFPHHTLRAMEVDFTPDLQAKLTRLAAEQGRDTQGNRARGGRAFRGLR